MTAQHRIHDPHTFGDIVRLGGRILRGLLAFTVLLALVAGLPWALAHYVGWPLPDHIPTRDEVQVTLLNRMSAQFLLNTLACMCWIVWFFFTIDVARCAVDAARGITWPEIRPAGPVRGLAAVLVGTIVLTVLAIRTPITPPATATVPTSDVAPVAVIASLPHRLAQPSTTTWQQDTMTIDWSAPAPPGMVKATEEVRLPHTKGGTVVYDSLWRVAERMFGDGNRWPELFSLNRGIVQPDGRALTKPHLIRPGWKITGYIAAPTPPTMQPPAPPAQPPKTPTSTTQPAPVTTQAPAGDTNTADHASERDTASQPGLDLLTGAFVSVLLAGVISAATVSARMWRRRRYRIGSGDRSDLHRPIAPVVRALRAAHDYHDGQTGLGDVEAAKPTPHPPMWIHATEADATAPDDDPGAVSARIGVRNGRELALNLASTRGLGVLGSGATAAARALLLHLLAQHTHDRKHVRVLLPAPDLPLIFDSAHAARLPSTVSVIDSLDAALDEMEAELLTRTRHLIDETTPRPLSATLVLLCSPAAHAERRLQAILDNGSTLGMAGILLGQWRPGATVRVRPDGTISATSPGLGDSLAGTRLFTMPAADAAELLAVLREAEGPANIKPSDADPRVEDLTQLELTRQPNSGGNDQRDPLPSMQLLVAQPSTVTETDAMPGQVPEGDHPETAEDATPAYLEPPDLEPARPPVPHPTQLAGYEAMEPLTRRRPLALSVLGPVELVLHETGAERQLAGTLTPKQREVLVHLALHPQGVRRDALNDAIWPDARPPRPFNSLHNALSLLRRTLTKATDGVITDIIRNDDGRYHLDSQLVKTDFEQFEAALQAPRTRTGADALGPLNEAIELYRGDLAEDLTAAWVEPFRESIRRDALDALSALIRLYGDTDPETGLVLLERSRKLDPYNESIYRDIIRTQARLGRYDAIARTLALLARTLHEIDQQPSNDTVNLAEFLQRRGITRRPSPDNAAAS